MIRRLLLFALLLVAGFAVLWAVTFGEDLGRLDTGANQFAQRTPPKEGVVVAAGSRTADFGKDITVRYEGGALSFRGVREQQLPDGRLQELPTYTLAADDSRARADGSHELDAVEVILFERGPNDTTRPAARLRAQRAIVTLGLDQKGRRSVAKDKDIELHAASLDSLPGARVEGVHLEMPRAVVRVTDDLVTLHSGGDQPVLLTIQDRGGPLTLTGHQASAFLPLQRDPPVEHAAVRIEIGRDSLLVHHTAAGESRLSAHGPLIYAEDVATRAATITASDRVQLVGVLPGAATTAANPRLVASGDRLEASLQRAHESGQAAQWRHVHLTGAPATLTSSDLTLTCSSLLASPGIGRAPWLVTASGTPHLQHRLDGRELTFTAERRIHLVRLQAHWQPWFSGLGLTPSAFSSQVRELLIFEGAAAVRLPQDEGELQLDAAQGLRVLRGDDDSTAMTILGAGTVAATVPGAQQPITIEGNRGFLLHAGSDRQTLRMGPELVDPTHTFVVRTADLTLRGSGACSIVRPNAIDAVTTFQLSSPAADLSLELLTTQGTLRNLASLTAKLDRAGVQSFHAAGPACELAWQAADERVDALATEIDSTGPGALTLRGAPAVVTSGKGGRLSGRTIHVVPLGGKHLRLVAIGNAQLVGRGGSDLSQSDLDLRAERIAVLPFLMPLSWLPTPSRFAHAALGTRHLIATGQVTIGSLDDQQRPVGSARGDTLVLRLQGDQRGRLLGNPALVVQAEGTAQEITAIAHEVLVRRAPNGESLALLPRDGVAPILRLRNDTGPLGSLGSADGITELTCSGAIEADPEAVRFLGPVDIASLLPNGTAEAGDFRLHATRLRLERDRADGSIARVIATDGADLRWRQISAKATDLTLDLRSTTCTVVDREGEAIVLLPNGVTSRCARAEFNYRTLEGAAWHTRVAEERLAR